MREILFRGRPIQPDKFDPIDDKGWIYGGIVHQTDCYNLRCDKWFIIDGTDTNDYDIGPGYQIDPSTIGQFSGLTDKNGKKIFEGDIVQSLGYCNNGRKYQVIFSEQRRGFFPFACGDGCGCCEEEVESPDDCIVIGNIHDNPELIEGQHDNT